MTAADVQRMVFDKMNRFFSGQFRVLIHQEIGEGINEWVLPVAYFDWKEANGLPATISFHDCPAEILDRPAVISDLAICTKYQRRNDKQYSVLFDPTPSANSHYIMIDDVEEEQATLQCDGRPGRLVIESSPGSFQVWFRFVESLSDDQRVELMQKYSPDEAAATAKRGGRFPGFQNRKPKYAESGYKYSKIKWCRFGTTTLEGLDDLVVYDRPERIKSSREPFNRNYVPKSNIRWSDYDSTGDNNRTDMSFGLALRNYLELSNPNFDPSVVAQEVGEGILKGRPEAAWHKKGGINTDSGRKNIERYIKMTVNKIMLRS